MKERVLQLKKIILKDWKGLNLEVIFNEGRTIVKGKNGIGKSSIIHAHNWLWSGYTDANSVKNSELFDNTKPLDQNTPIASVKEYIVVDGYDYTIERTAEAKFVRKRASNEYEKAASDVYTTKIDDIETSAVDFSKWIDRNICPVDLMPYLLDGTFFANLTINDKQKARKVLERLVGEVRDEDLSGDYDALKEKMKRFSLEEIKTQTKNQIKPLTQSSKEIDAVIKSNEKQLAKFSQVDFDELLKQITEKKAEIERLDKSITYASDAIKPIADKRAEITNKVNDMLSEMGDKRMAYEIEQKKPLTELSLKRTSIDVENAKIKKENSVSRSMFDELNKGKAELSKRITRKESEITVLRDELKEIKSRVFTDTKCAYCGQELPEDKLEAAKEKFNNAKQRDYEVCVLKGKEAKEDLNKLKNRLKEIEDELSKGLTLKELLTSDDIDKEIEKVKASFVPFEETDMYKDTISKIDKLKLTMPIIPPIDNTELLGRKESIMVDLEKLNREYGRKTDKDRIEGDIAELTKEKFECECKKAELEGLLDMIKAYESERAQIVSDRVNDKLNDCQVYMWSMLKSGERVEDCVLADKKGVKYATKNNSDRIKICLNVQHMFCKHFGIVMPIMIDEASVFDSNNLPIFEGQSIYMYASDDRQLVVE